MLIKLNIILLNIFILLKQCLLVVLVIFRFEFQDKLQFLGF